MEVTNNYTTSVNGSIPASISVTLTWQEEVNITQSGDLFEKGGGLRVKQITSSSGGSGLPMTREFIYHYFSDIDNDGSDEELSYGKIMSAPIFHLFTEANDGNLVQSPSCIRFLRFSNSVIPQSGGASGFSVGYDKVEVIRGGSDQNGKTIYHFYNDSDLQQAYYINNSLSNTHRGIATISYPTNGMLRAEYHYKPDGNGGFSPVKETQNMYMSQIEGGLFGISIFGSYPTDGPPSASQGTWGFKQEDVFLYRTPLISDWVYLAESKEITYDQKDPQIKLEVGTSYTYDPNHYHLITQSFSNSDQRVEQSKFKYPTDYDPTLSVGSSLNIQDMLDRNMVSIPLETQNWSGPDQNNLGLISASVTSFKDYQNTSVVEDKIILPQYTYLLETVSPLVPGGFTEATNGNGEYTSLVPDPAYYKQRVIIDYSPIGNITEVRQSNGSPNSYIWGYNEIIPIAEVINASQDEIAFTSFEEANNFGNWIYSGTTNTNPNSKTGLKVGDLSSSSIQATITVPSSGSMKYIVSYWKQGSPATVNGSSIATITETSGNWTYYEHHLGFSGAGTQNITINGSGLIDELRLHPLEGQMSTFSYDERLRVHTATDINSRSSYYLYDTFNRLQYVKDQDGNYVQSIEYNFRP